MNRRATMTLFSGATDPFSHQVRIVLIEKGIAADIVSVNAEYPSEDLVELNPYGIVPTLTERNLMLYESSIIMEYLEERYPHPPLLPVYPVARAQARLLMHRMRCDWYTLLATIAIGEKAVTEAARKTLQAALIEIAPLFGDAPYFMSEEFSLLDCCVLPLLWRLPAVGIKLGASNTKSMHEYAERLFVRRSFRLSLTDAEKRLRRDPL